MSNFPDGNVEPGGTGRRRPRTDPSLTFGAAGRQAAQDGRKLAPLDNGTVALGIAGMSFYWFAPLLVPRRKRRRRPTPPSSPQT